MQPRTESSGMREANIDFSRVERPSACKDEGSGRGRAPGVYIWSMIALRKKTLALSVHQNRRGSNARAKAVGIRHPVETAGGRVARRPGRARRGGWERTTNTAPLRALLQVTSQPDSSLRDAE